MGLVRLQEGTGGRVSTALCFPLPRLPLLPTQPAQLSHANITRNHVIMLQVCSLRGAHYQLSRAAWAGLCCSRESPVEDWETSSFSEAPHPLLPSVQVQSCRLGQGCAVCQWGYLRPSSSALSVDRAQHHLLSCSAVSFILGNFCL